MKETEKEIPTAEEFLVEKGFSVTANNSAIRNFMIEFAKLHVKKALEEASEKALVKQTTGLKIKYVNKKSILNAYPESNIK